MTNFTFTSNGIVSLGSGNGAGEGNDFTIGDKVYAASLRNETGDIIVVHVANLNGSTQFDAPRMVHSENGTDGHGAPAAMITEDGTIVILNSEHNSQDYYVSRISVEDFIAGKAFEVTNLKGSLSDSLMTYAWGPVQHGSEPGDPLYHFLRAGNPWGPQYTVSRDDGKTWSPAEKMIEQEGRSHERPYVKLSHTTENGDDVTHIFTNLGHPDRYNAHNSQGVYHMELRDGKFYANGREITLPADPVKEMNVVSAPGHKGIYEAAKQEGIYDTHKSWGNAWPKDSVSVDGKPYVLWTESPKINNMPREGAPTQIWWAGMNEKGGFEKKYVTTIEASYFFAIRGAGIDPNDPTIAYVIDRDDGGVWQLYRHDLVDGEFQMTLQLTDIPTGVTGLHLMDDVPGGVYVSQYYDADGELNEQIGPNVWDRQSSGFFIPNDRTTTELPDGPRTYTVEVSKLPDSGAAPALQPEPDPTPEPKPEPQPQPEPPAEDKAEDDPAVDNPNTGGAVLTAAELDFATGLWGFHRGWAPDGDGAITESAQSKDQLNIRFDTPDAAVSDGLTLSFDISSTSPDPGLLWLVATAEGGGYEDMLRTGIDPTAGRVEIDLGTVPDGIGEVSLSMFRTLQRNGDVTISSIAITSTGVTDDDADDTVTPPPLEGDTHFDNLETPQQEPEVAPQPDQRSPLPQNDMIDLGQIDSFEFNQDFGSAVVQDDGRGVTLTGNAWKALDGAFEITADTVLRFTFESPEDAEMQAIGFARNGSLDDNRQLFELAAEDTWSDVIKDFSGYAHGSGPQSFEINVGEHYARAGMLGTYDHLVLMNDDDAPDDGQMSLSIWYDIVLG